MEPVHEKKTTELRETVLWLTQAQAGLVRCTPEEYQAMYHRFMALLAAWRRAGWQEPGRPAAAPTRLNGMNRPPFRKAA